MPISKRTAKESLLIPHLDPELEAAANEELEAACTLSWRELAKVVPWGDSWEGFGPMGGAVHFERNYLWVGEPGGDLLCEVRVYRGQSRYDRGAVVSRVLKKPR